MENIPFIKTLELKLKLLICLPTKSFAQIVFTTFPFSVKQFQDTSFCILYHTVQKKVIQFHEGFQNSPCKARNLQTWDRLLG